MFHAMNDNGFDDGMTTGMGVFGIVLAALAAILAIIALVLFIAALISVLANKELTGGGKLLWIIGILYLPLFGAIAWFVVGKKRTFNRLLGIEKHSAVNDTGDSARHATPGPEGPEEPPHFRGTSPGPA